ncbi:hypothetical protein [Chamaesiphon sp. VAR_69_metabat_338]|uniref:hypothetical protein n=1 Tax=Chamaesiphon sp. VAR_69_metabat_338 TaxID=2964704 RepID=UPI00286DD6EA|nr:hypothetical protein [Chamaesiphon sp. VAR_69_metabat_338]
MSFNQPSQPIAPFQLLGDSLSQVAPVYVPLLIIASPALLINIAQNVLPIGVSSVLTLGYSVGVLPILTGTSIYFIYRYLKQGTADLSGAVNKALSQSGQLILGNFLYVLAVIVGFICLILPGIYLSVRWGFLLYAIVSQNCSAIDGFKYSSELVKGRWWRVFGSMLAIIPILLPVMFIAGIAGAIFARQPLIMAIISSIVGILAAPPIGMYYVKLFMRLQETANVPESV